MTTHLLNARSTFRISTYHFLYQLLHVILDAIFQKEQICGFQFVSVFAERVLTGENKVKEAAQGENIRFW